MPAQLKKQERLSLKIEKDEFNKRLELTEEEKYDSTSKHQRKRGHTMNAGMKHGNTLSGAALKQSGVAVSKATFKSIKLKGGGSVEKDGGGGGLSRQKRAGSFSAAMLASQGTSLQRLKEISTAKDRSLGGGFGFDPTKTAEAICTQHFSTL